MSQSTVIAAFSEEDAARLSGLSRGQLARWDRDGFFQPEYAYEARHTAHSRVYSFRDIVGLRTIAILRSKYRVSHQELRKVARELAERGFGDWADLRLFVVNSQVHFQDPASGEVEGVWDGQLAMLPVIDVIEEVTNEIDSAKQRTKDELGKVERHKFVVRNSEVIAGTRIPTNTIRRYIEAGFSIDQVLQEYPSLTRKDIKAVLSQQKGLAQSA